MTKWNVDIATTFTTYKSTDVLVAELVKVIPITNAGSAEICTLNREKVGARDPNHTHVGTDSG